ncbi:ATPase synthesis protein 25, mitochondrial [Taxawa tesnikishii (nom. ined.)]|nr:ATPase synthesis protein 25, mitochondrial [Dothideales sp. JES 119]
MALRNAISTSLACSGCRTQLLRSFVAAAGFQVSLPQRSQLWQRASPQQTSAFSSRASALAEKSQTDQATDEEVPISEQVQDEIDIENNLDAAATSDAYPPPQQQTAVPWYLQVNPPVAQQFHPLSERQRLPDLPPTPPPLLKPLLEHISVDLGLDDLSLLDLRSLDPPPALGANLLMIIGTARSEKHLHVSADRLCRWLRSTHQLSPYADGLLGRNELKLKMRRKAKRTRLLSAVGAKATGEGEVDDGIRTGWVCVNVGRVEGGVLEEHKEVEADESKGFVGFGGRNDGARIVVQMMTDEKRGQIDLEALWNGILRRANKAKESEKQDKEADESQEGQRLLENPVQPTKRQIAKGYGSSPLLSGPHVSSSQQAQQARAFHTSARRLALGSDHAVLLDQEGSKRQMLDHLKAMEPQAALEALGKGGNDRDSTLFLQSFYNQMPRFPSQSDWQCHLELHCYGHQLGHMGYTPLSLISQLEEMHLACLIPDEETYMLILRTLLPPAGLLTKRTDGSPDSLKLNKSLIKKLTLSTFRSQASTLNWSDFWGTWSSFPRRFLSRPEAAYATILSRVAETGHQRAAIRALRTVVPDMPREEPAVELKGEVAESVMKCLSVAEPKAEAFLLDNAFRSLHKGEIVRIPHHLIPFPQSEAFPKFLTASSSVRASSLIKAFLGRGHSSSLLMFHNPASRLVNTDLLRETRHRSSSRETIRPETILSAGRESEATST